MIRALRLPKRLSLAGARLVGDLAPVWHGLSHTFTEVLFSQAARRTARPAVLKWGSPGVGAYEKVCKDINGQPEPG